MTELQCPRCKARPFNLRSPGRLIIVDQADVRKLRALLRGHTDVDKCESCRQGLVGVVPTVFALFPDEALVLYAPGTLLRRDPTDVAAMNWRPYLGRPDVVPNLVQYPNLTYLRAAVRHQLSAQLSILAPLLASAADGDDDAYLAAHWRQFRPAALVAYALAVRDGDENLRIPLVDRDIARCVTAAQHHLAALTTPETAAPEAQLLALEILQLRVWQELCREWTVSEAVSDSMTSLQQDLDGHVVGSALSTGPDGMAVMVFDDAFAAGASPYVRAALRAAVARSLDRPNPAAQQWANYFFTHEVACRVHPGSAPARLVAAQVSTDFARATVAYREAWGAAAGHLALLHTGGPDGRLEPRPLAEAHHIVASVAEKAGHPRLADAVLESIAHSDLGDAGPEEIVAAVAAQEPLAARLALARLHLDAQPAGRRGAVTDAVGRGLWEAVEPRSRAEVIVWWANQLTRDQRFADTAQLLREHHMDDDDPDIAVAVRVRLCGVRAALLSAAGQWDGAVKLWRRVVVLINDHTDELTDARRGLRPWALVNLGLALADAGSPDEAVAVVEGVASGKDGYGADPEVFASMARFEVRFGRSEQAVEMLADAERLSDGFPAAHRYAQQRAQQLVVLGRDDEALQLLMRAADDQPSHDDHALLAEAASWAMLLGRGAPLPAGAMIRAERMPVLLAEHAGRAAARGDIIGQVALLGRAAEFAQFVGDDTGLQREQLVVLRRRHRMGDDPEELVRAAGFRLGAADLSGMRELLAAVPRALAARYGAVSDIGLLVREPRGLLKPLAELAGQIVTGDQVHAADVRLVAELQRDAIGRARTMHLDRSAAAAEPVVWLGDVGTRIPPNTGPVVVVEWVRTGEQSLRCLVTRTEDGESESAYLALAPVDPVVLRKRLASRLAGWPARALGSPLDEPTWRQLADSMIQGLLRYVQDGDHVVFLHNEVYADLPWHVVVGPHWTVSYAAGWPHLFRFLDREQATPRRLGICLVPRAGEVAGTLNGLRGSTLRAIFAAANAHMEIHRPTPELCDRAELSELLSTADVALMLCHGYQPRDGDDIGLMIAHAGELPPADSVAAARAAAGHFFNWRDCVRLPRTPRTILSAACASASTYGAGLGDRLGLFNALRHGGTAAMVAPPWDVVADDVLPVLDAVTARYLGGEPLGQALRAACTAFADVSPEWLAWSPALEGDWR